MVETYFRSSPYTLPRNNIIQLFCKTGQFLLKRKVICTFVHWLLALFRTEAVLTSTNNVCFEQNCVIYENDVYPCESQSGFFYIKCVCGCLYHMDVLA